EFDFVPFMPFENIVESAVVCFQSSETVRSRLAPPFQSTENKQVIGVCANRTIIVQSPRLTRLQKPCQEAPCFAFTQPSAYVPGHFCGRIAAGGSSPRSGLAATSPQQCEDYRRLDFGLCLDLAGAVSPFDATTSDSS